jgi:ferric-dicitrate binding protein FerR (iron transport regulator)
MKKGITEKARREFKAVLKLKPDHQKAREHLERLNSMHQIPNKHK